MQREVLHLQKVKLGPETVLVRNRRLTRCQLSHLTVQPLTTLVIGLTKHLVTAHCLLQDSATLLTHNMFATLYVYIQARTMTCANINTLIGYF